MRARRASQPKQPKQPKLPPGRGYRAEFPAAGQVRRGCAAGVIMRDGTIVRLEGEPPVAEGRDWFRPVE
jgi:hypothetical protein